MYTEGEYVANIFSKNFLKYNKKNIALYGTTSNTRSILENSKGFNFVGIMDGTLKSGNFFGKKILDYKEVLEEKVEIIVIVTRPNITKIIYNRISKFCKENDIMLFNVYGEDLFSKSIVFNKDNEYFDKNDLELKSLIDKNDFISFDIFDTLLMRKTLFPDDIFYIMEKKTKQINFHDLRLKSAKGDNLNIYEIYDNYQKITGISDNKKNELLNIELSIEKDFLSPREKMLEIFKYSVKKGKKVYLISDMYLTKDILKDILNTFGIEGYIDIFVSCEYKKLKSQGLYKDYLEKTNGNSYLHIGDDLEADKLYPNIYNINTYNIKSAYDMLEVSSYHEILNYEANLNERNILGLFIEKAFNNPFALFHSNGRLKIEDSNALGFLFLGPIITCFMRWLINNLKNREYEVILFAARDGYLINKLYLMKEIKGLPKSIYFLTSRFAGALSTSINEEYIKYFMSYSFDGNPKDILQKRFMLDKEEVFDYEDGEDINEYVLKHKEKIIKSAQENRKNYLKYINKIGLNNKNKIAFFDFVSSGTVQLCVESLLNKQITGFYFAHIISDFYKKRELNIKSLFKSGNAFEIKSHTFDNFIFLEYILTSFDSSLYSFDSLGDPIYLKETRTKDEIKYIKEIQEGVIEYYSKYLMLSNIEENLDLKIPDELFGFIDENYSNILSGNFNKNMVVKSEFANKNFLVKGV